MTLLTASVLPLVAQGVTSGLTLEKNGEQVLIPMDERLQYPLPMILVICFLVIIWV